MNYILNIEINKSHIARVQKMAKQSINRKLTDEELIEFLENDIGAVYDISTDDGYFKIEDAVADYCADLSR